MFEAQAEFAMKSLLAVVPLKVVRPRKRALKKPARKRLA